ncbi:MAG: hypothetical protein V3U83_06955 [Acidobacteriota bacterium]
MRYISKFTLVADPPQVCPEAQGGACPGLAGRRIRHLSSRLMTISACTVLLFLQGATLPAAAEEEGDRAKPAAAVTVETPKPPAFQPIRFQAPSMPAEPAKEKGRLTMRFDGNRRWCTYPDDRVMKPPQRRTQARTKARRGSEVHTFGYQFTVAAIRRGDPTQPLLLYESPLIRTASLRNAAKLGRGGRQGIVGPGVGGGGRTGSRPRRVDNVDGLVPYWQERYRCTTLDEIFRFDLAAGVYDIYAAFDLMNRGGGWVHRTVAFIEEVPIETGQATLLEGVLDMRGLRRRNLEFVRATTVEAGSPDPPDVP